MLCSYYLIFIANLQRSITKLCVQAKQRVNEITLSEFRGNQIGAIEFLNYLNQKDYYIYFLINMLEQKNLCKQSPIYCTKIIIQNLPEAKMLREQILVGQPVLYNENETFNPYQMNYRHQPNATQTQTIANGNEVAHRQYQLNQQCNQMSSQNVKPNPNKILGSIKIKYIVAYFAICLFVSPIYTYHMAVSQGQEKPFPSATITSTACHYPQDTLFRFLNLQAGSFLCLLYWLIYRWTSYQKKRIGYPKSNHSWLLWLSLASLSGFFIAVGTIDIKGTGKYHGPGAVFFFIVLYVVVVNYTIMMRKMHHWDSSFLSRCSLVFKQITCGYVTCVFIYFLYGLIFDGLEQFTNSDKYVVVMEWNLVLVCEMWIMTFYFDWRKVKFVLLNNGKASLQNQ